MDAKELQQKTTDELRHLSETLRTEIRDLRFKASLRSLRTVRDLRDKRKTLARIMSAMGKHTS